MAGNGGNCCVRLCPVAPSQPALTRSPRSRATNSLSRSTSCRRHAAFAPDLRGNQISGAPRHRRDVVSVTASARWRRGSTPSMRCCPRGRVGSMAYNLTHCLISTQPRTSPAGTSRDTPRRSLEAPRRRNHLNCGRSPRRRPPENFASRRRQDGLGPNGEV